MIYAVLDFAEIHGRTQLHSELAEKLELPVWYGKNLDALYDCLTEPGENIVLGLKNLGMLEENLGGYGRTLLRVLEEVQGEGARFRYEIITGDMSEDSEDIG